jgi:hypothetical protein
MDGRTVIFAIKCNVNDMLFLHGHLLAMLVSASLLNHPLTIIHYMWMKHMMELIFHS